jgi:hypothetical protein
MPKRAKKQDPPGTSYMSQNAANDGDRKPVAIDTAPKPQCDEVHAVHDVPRLLPTFAGLDTASDADSPEAQVVGSHIRQTCSVHNFVSVNNGVTTQEWLDSNKEYCPGCHCFVCEIEASKCPHWSVHCCADVNGPWGDFWRTQREAARAARNADELIPDDGNIISGSRDDDCDVGDPEDDTLTAVGQCLEAVSPVAGNHSNESPEADALLEQLGPLFVGELLAAYSLPQVRQISTQEQRGPDTPTTRNMQPTTTIMQSKSSVKSKRQQWDDDYDSVLAFAKEHTHLNLPSNDTDTRRLSHWLNTQKKRKTHKFRTRQVGLA